MRGSYQVTGADASLYVEEVIFGADEGLKAADHFMSYAARIG